MLQLEFTFIEENLEAQTEGTKVHHHHRIQLQSPMDYPYDHCQSKIIVSNFQKFYCDLLLKADAFSTYRDVENASAFNTNLFEENLEASSLQSPMDYPYDH